MWSQVAVQGPLLLNYLFDLLTFGNLLGAYLLLCNKAPNLNCLEQQPLFSLLMNLRLARTWQWQFSCSFGGI